MTGRRPKLLPRRAIALALGVWLMAAQQLALLHPLSHLHDEAPPLAHAHAHDTTPASAAGDAAEAACTLCLACAAASPLATGASVAHQPLARGMPPAASAVPPPAVARAPSTGHNRGPPVRA